MRTRTIEASWLTRRSSPPPGRRPTETTGTAAAFVAPGASGPDSNPGTAGNTADDTDAEFSAVVRDRQDALARLAYALCGDPQHAEDAVAEAFAKVYVQWRRGRVDDLAPYLRRAVINQVHARHRRRALERREERRHTVDGRTHDRFDARVDDHEVLWDALATLPLSQRSVVVLRIVEDLSEAETARALGVRKGTVKSRLSRAMATLRDELGPEGLGIEHV
ncbi:MAG: SigE family RNA polymerase sigma factor [Actinomycetota bacterium]|nr:SigE family RNA polymerase sigma factor [Actinomycetota bacterium]